MSKKEKFDNLQQFWPFYLNEHRNKSNRLLHFVGTGMSFFWLFKTITKKKPSYILMGILNGYGLSWAGHFFFEKNKPAAIKYPFKSFLSDWKMFYFIGTGKIDSELEKYPLEK